MRATFAFLCLGLFLSSLNVVAQTTETGSISGRVTSGDKPLINVIITLDTDENLRLGDPTKVLSTHTDANGQFEFTGLTKGTYQLSPKAYKYALPNAAGAIGAAKSISLAAGEHLTDLNLDLVEGGVITGKLTDHKNRPLPGQAIRVATKGPNGRLNQIYRPNFRMFQTDDRGIYRIYGLQAGKYLVSAGESSETIGFAVGGPPATLPLVYYPGTSKQSEAKAIDVVAGKESSGIDLQVGPPEAGHAARGRVTDSQSGAPIANVKISHGLTKAGSDQLFGAGNAGERSDLDGSFSILGLKSGRYSVFIEADNGSDLYSEPLFFTVDNEDVDGLEVRALHGATITGQVVLQEEPDSALAGRLPQIMVSAFPVKREGGAVRPNSATVKSNGTFEIRGVPAGTFSIIPSVPLPLQQVSLEYKGMPLPRTIDIGPGEKVSGIRIVLGTGSGVIAGEVTISGGKLPDSSRIMVSCVRIGTSTLALSRGNPYVDARGRFRIENLLPGTYMLSLSVFNSAASTGQPNIPRTQRKEVIVGAGETPVTFTLDLSVRKEN